MSKETQDFFKLMGKESTQLFSLQEFKNLHIPVLQSVFSREEVRIITQVIEHLQLEEDVHYQKMIESMFQAKLELQQKELLDTIKPSKTRGTNHLSKQKISIDQKSTIAVPSQSWQEIIPIKRTNVVKLLYPTHVTRWFDNPKDSLQDPKYTSIIKQFGKETCLYFHRFTTIIDKLVGTEYSLQNEVENERTGQRDILYGIPGEIEITGKKYRGFFQYIIDVKSGICYHRCFNHRSKNFMEDVIEERIWRPKSRSEQRL